MLLEGDWQGSTRDGGQHIGMATQVREYQLQQSLQGDSVRGLASGGVHVAE